MWDTRVLIPGLGRSPGGGHGNPLQYPCLENSMDRGAWQGTVLGVAKNQTRLSACTHTHTHTHTPKVWGGMGAGWGNLKLLRQKTDT